MMELEYDVFIAKGQLVKRELRGCIQMDSTTWLKRTDGKGIYIGDLREVNEKYKRPMSPSSTDILTYELIFDAFPHKAAHIKEQLGDYRGDAVLYCRLINTLHITAEIVAYRTINN
jgi:hypothetical protein